MPLDDIAIARLADADISSCQSIFDVAYGDLHRSAERIGCAGRDAAIRGRR